MTKALGPVLVLREPKPILVKLILLLADGVSVNSK